MKKEKVKIPNLWNRCQKAASLLDKEVPDWYTKVNPKQLDFSVFWSNFNLCGCVSGQYSRNKGFKVARDHLHDIIVKGEQRLYGVDPDYYESIVFSEPRTEHHKKLTRYWTTLILKRSSNDNNLETKST